MWSESLLPDPWIPFAKHYIDSSATLVITSVTGTWTSANRAIYVPFVLPCDAVVYAVYHRGNNATGNYDLGLYDPDMNLMTSKGSTANAAALLTFTLSSAMKLYGGYTYWIGVAFDSGSSSFYRYLISTQRAMDIAGLGMQDTAFALPSTMTPVANTTTQVPLVGLGVR